VIWGMFGEAESALNLWGFFGGRADPCSGLSNAPQPHLRVKATPLGPLDRVWRAELLRHAAVRHGLP
jgi:hypothetical protein